MQTQVYEALKTLPAFVARGTAVAGASLPSVFFKVSRQKKKAYCEVLVHAYMAEQADALLAAAQERLKALGFLRRDCSEGVQRDTGVFTRSALLEQAETATLLLNGQRLEGLRHYTFDCRSERRRVRNVEGEWRSLGGPVKGRLHLCLEGGVTVRETLLSAAMSGEPLHITLHGQTREMRAEACREQGDEIEAELVFETEGE